jgi:hypothetical protein
MTLLYAMEGQTLPTEFSHQLARIIVLPDDRIW